MNDPNGLAIVDGRLHAFYQYEPDVPRWGRMRWGHAVSSDMLTWQHLPVALEPDPAGPDRLGCWSGCLVDDGGVPTIFYTGVDRAGGLRHASIWRATSDDGLRTWRKAEAAAIARPPAGIRPDRFRDPFVWREASGDWAMLLGAGTTRGRAAVLLYRSDDLRTWRYVGPFVTLADVVAMDPDVVVGDIDGPCWECPQLLRLGDADVLVVSVVDWAPRIRPAHVMAFTGEVVGERFVVRDSARLDLGPDFYAPAVVRGSDGRHLLFGWIPEDPPARRSTRTWAGSLTFPREASLDAKGRLRVTVASEVDHLGGESVSLPDATVTDGGPWVHAVEGGTAELRMRLVPEGAASVRIDIAGSNGTVAELRFDPRDRRISVVRTGRVVVAGRDPHGTAILPTRPEDVLDLRLLLDGSVLEVVADDRLTATARMPEVVGDHRTITVTTIGGACGLTALRAGTFSPPAADVSPPAADVSPRARA